MTTRRVPASTERPSSISCGPFERAWVIETVTRRCAAAKNGNLAGDSYTHSGGGLTCQDVHAQLFLDGANRLTQAAESRHWQRGFAYDPWVNSWVNQVSGLALAGNTPTTNVYDPNTNWDTGWQYDGAGNLLQANGGIRCAMTPKAG